MRQWSVLGVALLVVTLGTGCPELYSKGGYMDDAMREDMEEQQRQRREEERTQPGLCPDGKPPKERCEDGLCYRRCP